MKKLATTLIGFVILFLLYHTAEYMIVVENSVVGFFMGQALFFTAAYGLARWQSRKGLSTWGLGFSADTFRTFLTGTLMGLALYGGSWLLNLALGLETIQKGLTSSGLINEGLPFAFGVFFSSLSEDILTRGYVSYHLRDIVRPGLLGVISALVYVLNHIHKLGNSPDAWLYLFPLGLLYVIPLILTGKLWFTGAMHWSGNVFFFISHDLINTQYVSNSIPSNYIFCGYIFCFIPITIFVLTHCRSSKINCLYKAL